MPRILWLFGICICTLVCTLPPPAALAAQTGGTLELLVRTTDSTTIAAFEVEVLGTNLGTRRVEGERARIEVPHTGVYLDDAASAGAPISP